MKKTCKLLCVATALTMLCTAATPVFSTAADPAPATVKVDEDTSLCGYVLLTSLNLAGAQEAVGDTGTVYTYDSWSEWYPTITVDFYPGEDVHVLNILSSGDGYSYSAGDLIQQEECDDKAFFVVPKQLDEESVVLTCRRLFFSMEQIGAAFIACPMYQDQGQTGAYANSAFLKAGQIHNQDKQTGIASVNPDDAMAILKKYADSLVRPDYVSDYFKADFIDASPMRADINGDGSIDQEDCLFLLKVYVGQLVYDCPIAFEATYLKEFF